MLESAATLELKARLAELRQRLLRVRENVDKDAGSHSRDNSPNPTVGKNHRLSVSDEDIAALIRDANTTVGSLVSAMNSTPTVTSNHVVAAAVSAAAAAASPTAPAKGKENAAYAAETMGNGSAFDAGLPKAEPDAETSWRKSTLQAAAEADDTEAEKARDLQEWLLFTNFYDKAYRREFLSVHRRAAARRAALEAIEAQKQKLLEEMEQDDHELAMVQFGAGGASWAKKKLAISQTPPAPHRVFSMSAPSATAPHLKQLSAASVAQDASAAPVSIAPISTAPDTLAAPAVASPAIPGAPAPTTQIIPTGPDAPVAPAVSAAPASTAPIANATPDVPAASASTAPVVPAVDVAAAAVVSVTPNSTSLDSTAPDSTAPDSTAPDTPTAPATTAPVAPVSTAPAAPTAPEALPDRFLQFEIAVTPLANNRLKAKPSKRAFDETLVKEEENNLPPENNRPAKTIRTDKASKSKAQANSPLKSAPTGANGSPAHKPAQSLKETRLLATDKTLADKAQTGLPPKPAPAVAGAALSSEDTRPAKSARQDKTQADKAHTNLPANLPAKPGPAGADGVQTQPAAARTSISHADATNGHGGLKIRGAAVNGVDSPAQKSASWFVGRGSGDDGGSATTNMTIAGLARATRPPHPELQSPNSRTADAQAETPNTGASLESRAVKPDKSLSLEDVNGRPLHERITKPVALGRRGESRFFLLKAFNSANIRTSMNDGLWVTRIADMKLINDAFDKCRNVIFFFTINKSHAFQGYARMVSRTIHKEPRSEWMKSIPWPTTPPFRIEWHNTTTTYFKKVAYLKNPLIDGASVTTGKDGSEIEEECARGLMREMDLPRDQRRADNKTSQSWSRGGRSPSYAQDHEFPPYVQEYEGERASFEEFRRRSPDRGVGYYGDYNGDYGDDYGGNYGGDYGGGGSGGYDSWVPRQNDGPQNSFRPQSWR